MDLFGRRGTVDAWRFGAGMVVDPLQAMLKAGIATGQARELIF